MFPDEENKELIELLESRRYAKAHAWLNRQGSVQLRDEDASICLTAALHATPNLFRKVLSRCPQREYSGKVRMEVKEGVFAYVHGTMLTLAAALNRPEHVRILLQTGYDPNSSGSASATAFLSPEFWFTSEQPASGAQRIAVNGSRICFSGKAGWMIRNATPLAAAVACGSRAAAAVLLRCREVWTAESSVVCRASVSALQMFKDNPRQELAGMVFGRMRRKRFCPREFAQTCDLQIEHSADFCTYELMETQIRHHFCDEEGARNALRLLDAHAVSRRHIVRARMRKMELLVREFPMLGQESWVAGLFLQELVWRYKPEKPHVRLMQRWKTLCGEEGDLTWARMGLYHMSRPYLQSLLKVLSKEIHLVMDADSLGSFCRETKGELTDILNYVELRHNRGLEGVSALAVAVLRMSSDQRFLRKAAKLGVFAGEEPAALLKYLDEIDLNHLRALVLTYGGQGDVSQPPRWKSECRGNCWSRYWGIGHSDYERWLQELTNEVLSEEECLKRLQGMNHAVSVIDFWRMECNIAVNLPHRTVRVERPEAAVSCGAQTQPLRLMMRYMPEKLYQKYSVDFCDRTLLNLSGTPLALAAATGRTELVQMLLSAGIHPDEEGQGVISALRWFNSDVVAVTPVMAAIYYGEEETALQLLNAGAVCDFSQPCFREILRRGDERTLETAKKLPNVNFESIPQEWLDHCRKSGDLAGF